jgi:uncharacterized NAD(P)/FAD-binding protein YdhS
MLKIRVSSPRTKSQAYSPVSRVAIVGGGYTGATVARLLVERGYRQIDEVIVFEPREQLGSGLAYDTQDPHVRLNVAAHRMPAVPGAPMAFLDWLQSSGTLTVDPEAITKGGIFARRRDFGRFMHQQMSSFLKAGSIQHCRETVSGISRQNDQWHLKGSRGTTVTADVLVLATGHPSVSVPEALSNLDVHMASRVKDASGSSAFKDVGRDDRILVIGCGLTALDALVRLDAQGHCGKISLLSRSGLMPRPHALGSFTPYGNFEDESLTTARRVLAKVRATLLEAQEQGIPWQFTFDALRQQAQAIWRRLSQNERRKLLRLRRWYDVHRYRVPPQVSDLLRSEIAKGRIETLRGRFVGLHGISDGINVTIADGIKISRQAYDHIILATGPQFRDYATHQKFMLDLAQSGFIQSDPLGLGLICDLAGRAMCVDGTPNTKLYVAGPPARSAFGELTGVPEIAAQAAHLVDVILKRLDYNVPTISIVEK